MNPNSSYEVSLTILNLDGDRLSLIKAGLHVHPWLYHNNDLRFFTSSSDDATKKGACYNMGCPGFVVANSSVLYPGQAVAPLSQYNGEDRYVTLSIIKDPVTELWTLYREDFGTSSILGWWQKGLGDMDNKATNVQWLAFVDYQDNDTGPTMGSGHYPVEGYQKAAYMMNLKLYNKKGGYDSPKIDDLVRDDDKDICYRSLPAHAGYQTYAGDYYGSQVKISAWGVPNMNPDSSYEASLTLANYNGDRTSLIRAGLHDDANRKPWCYNTDCPCFVAANASVLFPGQAVAPLSQYDGEDRYVTLSIKKDPVTEVWSLYREDFGTSSILGWWKKGLLGDMDDKANRVQWLSFVSYRDNDSGPSMGSGHWPGEGNHKAAYMGDLKLFDKAGNADSPVVYDDLYRDDDKPDCYKALPAWVLDDDGDKHKFYYGGPAGCRN
ncbi:hypothetical protein FCM35_KLT01896 [Carex littledalei]|uniref:Neprosin PEP catalytic domain-containing protein n=1 Tax=Carex littledalei TaxID=544730 RepID=A0A833QZ69_9POAL|nr:hypothetical protein FCM35_KLT01896 [Carex littledalei]